MARKKKGEGDNSMNAEPDFELAAKIIREQIAPDRENVRSMQGDLSAEWKRVEDVAHVNRKAAKDALRISQMSQENMSDYLRSLLGMMPVLGIAIQQDLVDGMENISQFVVPIRGAPASELVQ